MAKYTKEGPVIPESRGQSFVFEERQLYIEFLPKGDHAQSLVALAWTMLSSVYSENNDATIDTLDPTQPQEIVCVHLHLDAEQSMKEVQGQFQQKLQERSNGSDAATFQNRSGLPKTLIATKIDDVIQRLALEKDYVLVIAGQESRSDNRSLVLTGYYNSSKLDSRDLCSILDRVGNLITQLGADREQKIGTFDLMCASDKEQLVIWNGFMPPSLDVCMHELIQLQSKRHPHNEAVCAWDGSFTYEELDRRATALAKKLAAVGVSLGSNVPLMFEKSKWHIVSLLAVLKAGAAFVALEHTMPDGRIQMILEQLGSLPLILASASQSVKLKRFADLVIIVNEDATSDDLSDVSLPVPGTAAGLQPDHPAYMIFTSGSTGTPKGVIIEHRQLSTSMQALSEKIAFTPDMRIFQMTAFNFDLSLSEIFCPLLGGGCICLPSEWTRFNDLGGAVESLNANFGSFSPSFLATLSNKDFPKLKTILLAGERVSADLSSFWTSHGRRMVHMYGPTECTVGCCFLDTNVQPHYDGFIGDSYSSKLWVVDPDNHNRLMPIGAPGEFLVEGPIVGRCYLADSKKTRESFIECPSWFSTLLEREPSRFYKTGDLGRLIKSGGYDIIGRKDTQTKIRGLRVEIQEIEHQIRMAYGSQVGVAVEVRNPTFVPGQEMLVAFLDIKSQEESPESSSMSILWEELASNETLFSRIVDHVKVRLPELLPDYMLPLAYLPIRSLPFSNSYKLDRRALKERANSLTISEIQKALSSKVREHEDRRSTEKEVMLRSLWVKILHAAPATVGIEEDFFHNGGDSLKAMTLVSAARRRGIYFSVAQLYQYRTIAELSQLAGEETYEDSQIQSFSLINNPEAKQLQEMAAHQCGIKVETIEDIMPVLDMQRFYLECQRHQPCSWQVPLAFELPLDVDSGRLQRTWEKLLAYYPITRTRFIDTPFGIFQIVLKHDKIHWRSETNLTELLKMSKNEDMSFGFKTHQSALLKASDQKPMRLIWYVNHAITDQIMNEHLTQELSNLYHDGLFSPPKRRSFKSVVHYRLRSNKVSSQAFWHSHLRGAKYGTLLEAAKDSKTVAYSNRSCETRIESPEWLKISEYSFPVTAWALTLARFAGVKDVPFFMIRAGRASTLPGSEDVIGPLLARAPLRVSVQRDARIVDLLRDVHGDIEESRNHEIVREDEFRNVSPEAAAHLLHGININFVPSSSGLTLGSDALLRPPEDVRCGLGYQTLRFVLAGELRHGVLKMEVTWDEESIPGESIQALLSDFESTSWCLNQLSPDMTVNGLWSLSR